MKKRIFAIVLVTILSFSAFSVVASAEETDVLTFTQNFNYSEENVLIQYPRGGTCADASKAVNANTFLGDTPYGLQLKTMKDTVARRTFLGGFDGDNNGVIPAGKYTVSIWVRHNSASSSDWVTEYFDYNAHGEILFTLYDENATDTDELTAEDGFSIKLLPQENEGNYFEQTEEKTYSLKDGEPDKEWYKYTAEIITQKEYSQFAFWCISNNDAKSLYAYVDDLEITGVAGAFDDSFDGPVEEDTSKNPVEDDASKDPDEDKKEENTTSAETLPVIDDEEPEELGFLQSIIKAISDLFANIWNLLFGWMK
jgi:hypothetical protein